MSYPVPTVPWNAPALWKEANTCLSKTLQRNVSAMAELYPIADRIKRKQEALFPIMDELCRVTCPQCTDICCLRAWVWADFKDLLFLHLAGITVPDQQLLHQQKDVCRYASPQGCRLERIQRPFVCTWYICPVQGHLLRKKTEEKKIISENLQEIKKLRKILEADFVQSLF